MQASFSSSYERELQGVLISGVYNNITALFFIFRYPRRERIRINGTGKVFIKSESSIFNNYFGISWSSPIEVQLPIDIPSSDGTSNTDMYMVLNPDRVSIDLSVGYAGYGHIFIS